MDGKERRLRKIINKKTGRSLVLAVDHGMALGAMTGIVDIAGTIRTLDATNKVDCWLMTKGIYTHAFDPSGDPGVILRASGGATIAGPELTREGQTADAEEALRLGVDAMATTAFVGSVYEHETLISMARMATECRKWDMPLLGVIGLGKTNEDKKKDPKFIALGARVGAEHGADIIKTYYTETDFEKVVAGCPVPVMIAGGPKCETDLDTLNMIYGALQGGAKGIVMGRNVWQSPHPTALLSAVYGLIHEGMNVKEAADLLAHEVALDH
ncbi:class I fructose-bisphosphate aldolase [Desulfobacter postgatei]|uniref:DhnA-type fructose-1,6-bisphosphate aldolase-like enzyme n=1 Tax=Desulfobacter postgatei 2ac9 TaxID=879212 RepID=I5AZ73_9BACT|nr:fructose-bisphosphate aldolase [Desulfobacter postgatei]EIM62536.1 DhnA-type fructose-1,6-bisphosphate aldolase-like enzyme [Desulfobacter postgatei 2ac9]